MRCVGSNVERELQSLDERPARCSLALDHFRVKSTPFGVFENRPVVINEIRRNAAEVKVPGKTRCRIG